MSEPQLPQVNADDFSRRFALRAANLMWFLGAGASAAAGIATAWDMIWDFKQRLFVSQQKVSPKTVADLSNPTVCARLQAHIDSLGNLPSQGAPDEYAAVFELVYPSEADRRAYLDSKMAGAKPSFGHMALATLMRGQLTRLVWTTNFDPLVADACAKVYDATGALTTVALDAPDLASQVIGDGRWPIEIKLHGDFRSRRLKNTNDELRHQDTRLRKLLIDACRRFGLIVVGYSGRDDSVMDALSDAIEPGAFPAGLFWLHRGESPPLPRVSQLIRRGVEAGVEAALVQVENFDESLRDLMRLITNIDTTALDSFRTERRRWTASPRPTGQGGWPVLRLNALPIIHTPSVCRRIVCDVGGHAEARAVVNQSGVDALTSRSRSGVLAFGSDNDLRTAFQPFNITDFDLHTIEAKRLRYDSSERGLLREAITRAVMRHRGLSAVRRRATDLLVPVDLSSNSWTPLRGLVGALTGPVPGIPDLQWREGIATRLDWADDRLWYLFEPRTVFEGITATNKSAAADFARERTVKRFNRQLNDLIAFWAAFLAGDGTELRSLGIGDGIDAVFRLSADTGFSRKARP